MKTRNFIFFTLILLCFVSIHSCSEGPVGFNPENNPQQIISIDKAVHIFKNEKQVKDKIINPVLREFYQDKRFQDTEFAWFSLDVMKNYINYIEAVQKENPNKNVSGIRVYMGRYDKEITKNYVNQQTVFFVPTVSHKSVKSSYKNLNHLPFGILPDNASNPIKGQFKIIEPLLYESPDMEQRFNTYEKYNTRFNEAGFNFMPLFDDIELTSLILNEGELSPPPKKKD